MLTSTIIYHVSAVIFIMCVVHLHTNKAKFALLSLKSLPIDNRKNQSNHNTLPGVVWCGKLDC